MTEESRLSYADMLREVAAEDSYSGEGAPAARSHRRAAALRALAELAERAGQAVTANDLMTYRQEADSVIDALARGWCE